MYGITETTVYTTLHRITEADMAGEDSVIGLPLPGFIARVVDEQGQPAASGELLLAGPQVSQGYLNRPALTAARFVSLDGHLFYRSGDLVQRDAGGTLTYLGRADDQVKVRGHRVELGEVEAALMRVPEVSGVIATMFSLADEESLGCVYTTVHAAPLPRPAIRELLRDLLPDYMAPAKALWRPVLPQTLNGKADRRYARTMLENGMLRLPLSTSAADAAGPPDYGAGRSRS